MKKAMTVNKIVIESLSKTGIESNLTMMIIKKEMSVGKSKIMGREMIAMREKVKEKEQTIKTEFKKESTDDMIHNIHCIS